MCFIQHYANGILVLVQGCSCGGTRLRCVDVLFESSPRDGVDLVNGVVGEVGDNTSLQYLFDPNQVLVASVATRNFLFVNANGVFGGFAESHSAKSQRSCPDFGLLVEIPVVGNGLRVLESFLLGGRPQIFAAVVKAAPKKGRVGAAKDVNFAVE